MTSKVRPSASLVIGGGGTPCQEPEARSRRGGGELTVILWKDYAKHPYSPGQIDKGRRGQEDLTIPGPFWNALLILGEGKAGTGVSSAQQGKDLFADQRQALESLDVRAIPTLAPRCRSVVLVLDRLAKFQDQGPELPPSSPARLMAERSRLRMGLVNRRTCT